MPHTHPGLEPLEPRRILAVSVVNGVLSGTAGDDVIVITPRADNGLRVTLNGETRSYKNSTLRLVRGLGGDDRIVLKSDASPYTISVDAGDGDDTVKTALALRVIKGGAGDDRIVGSPRPDRIEGGPGSDTVRAGAGNDLIDGGGGSDVLYGDEGNDSLDGRGGADYLSGGDGNDGVDYGTRTGKLRITIDDEADDGEDGERDDVRTDVEDVQGGSNDDLIIGSAAGNGLAGDGGNDTIYGLGGDDWLGGGLGSDLLYGGTEDDLLESLGGSDILHGEAGNDFLLGTQSGGPGRYFGGDGDDSIEADNGQRDRIDGGLGDDLARGDDFGDSYRSVERGIRPR